VLTTAAGRLDTNMCSCYVYSPLLTDPYEQRSLPFVEPALGQARPHDDTWEPVFEAVEIPAVIDLAVDTLDRMPAQASARIPARGVSHALFDAVREVALVAAAGDVDAARLVSKASWNEARARAAHEELPTADAIRARFGVPQWSMVLAVVFHEQTKRFQLLGTLTARLSALGRGARVPDLDATREEAAELVEFLAGDDLMAGDADPAEAAKARPSSPEVAVAVMQHGIRAATYRVGHAPAIDEYDTAIVLLERERYKQTLPPLGFPTSQTVIKRYGSWSRALADVGLEAPAAWVRDRGLEAVVVLDACIDEWGVLPGKEGFRLWCKTCDLSVRHISDRWAEVVAEVRRLRAGRGAKTPDTITARAKQLPPMPSPERATAIRERLGGPRRIERRRPDSDIEDSLRIYAQEHLAEGDKASRRSYMAAARKDKRMLWPSGLTRKSGKTLTTLFREAGL
jgi:hypothetical protein